MTARDRQIAELCSQVPCPGCGHDSPLGSHDCFVEQSRLARLKREARDAPVPASLNSVTLDAEGWPPSRGFSLMQRSAADTMSASDGASRISGLQRSPADGLQTGDSITITTRITGT